MNFKLMAVPSIVLRVDDGASIPADPRNRDWQAYQAWLVLGNTPLPADDVAAPVALSTTAKLAQLGLSVAELKTALA